MSTDLDALLSRVAKSSKRLRGAMGITAALCMLIAAGIASDQSLWRSGVGWRAAGLAGVIVFASLAALMLYWAFWRQPRHAEHLRRLLIDDPGRIASIRLRVARAAPNASWVDDAGSATRGLNIIVSDSTGTTWVLPVSRAEADEVLPALARHCPFAEVTPKP